MKLEYAWAAGIIDGEGCFTSQKHSKGGKKYPRLVISQSSNCGVPEILLRCKALFGGSINIQAPRGKQDKPAYKLYLGSKATKLAAEKVWPWLGKLKKEQAKQVGIDILV